MDEIIQVLAGIRDQLDALIVGLATDREAGPRPGEPSLVELKEDESCKHEHRERIDGASESRERWACVDCGKEL